MAETTQVRMTVAEAAALWGLSTARIKVLCEQGRIAHEKVGKGPSGGARLIFIMQAERPEKAAPGELSPEQRKVKAQRSGPKKKAPPRAAKVKAPGKARRAKAS